MELKRLVVRRFRGIQELDWIPEGRIACLVGPGDATTTTILTAAEWALSPRWSIATSDSDFYDAVTDEPIVIEATIWTCCGTVDKRPEVRPRGARLGIRRPP